MFTNQLEKLLEKHFLKGFCLDILNGLEKLYPQTWDEVTLKHQGSVAQDALPYSRHFSSLSLLKSIAESRDMHSSFNYNKAKNCCHAKVRQGNMVMTINRAKNPNEIIRTAWFRKNYALVNQGWLPGIEPLENETNDDVYTIIIHGSDSTDPRHLGFAHLVAPAPNQKEYLARLDLTRLRDMPIETDVEDIELITPAATPRLIKSTKIRKLS